MGLYRETFQSPKAGSAGHPLNRSWSSVNFVEHERTKTPVHREPAPYAACTGLDAIESLSQATFQARPRGEGLSLSPQVSTKNRASYGLAAASAPYTDLVSADGRSSTVVRPRGGNSLQST